MSTDENGCEKDRVIRRPQLYQDFHTARSESTQTWSKSKDVGVIRQMNGSIRPGNGNPEDFQCNTTGVESSYATGTQQSAPRTDRQPVLCRNSDRFSNLGDLERRQSSYNGCRKTSSTEHCQNNCLPSGDHECGFDTATISSTPLDNSLGVHSRDNNDSSTDIESLKCHGSRNFETTRCCKMRPEDVELQTPHEPDCVDHSHASQKPDLDSDKVIVNGISASVPVIDNIPDDISADDDGVVFNTSDFEVICVIKSEKELRSRLEVFCEPLTCSDALDWDVGTPDVPQKAQTLSLIHISEPTRPY